ncbi:MAG: gfo/Idh/MocA family oxidoreductase [Paenibacillus sp.]|nr:gfo/Idh/MocA family oxidoreductase [Paenibacillus sp.]
MGQSQAVQASPYRSLLIGTGGWANAHAQAYGLCRDVRLAGICGHSSGEKLQRMIEQYGVAHAGLDAESLMREIQPDIVDVACNPHYRLQAVAIAVRYPSVRLINLEKPIALTPGEAYEIERLCREHGKLLTVNHQKKLLPAWRAARERIDSGAIGEVEYIRASCQGNLLEQGTHLIDMAMHVNGYSPLRWLSGQVDALEGLNKPQSSSPDAAVAELCFDNGVRAYMEFGASGRTIPGATNKWMQFAVDVYGAKGHMRLRLETGLDTVIYADGEQGGQHTSEPGGWGEHYMQALAGHLESLAAYIRQPELGHISDLGRSMMSFQAVMGIYASSLEGGIVRFPLRFPDDLQQRLAQRGG